MKQKTVIKFAVLMCAFSLLFFLGACSSKRAHQVQDIKTAMSKANINYESIHHIETIDEGVVVYYLTTGGLNEGFIERKRDRWKWVFGGGSAGESPQNGVSWQVTNVKEMGIGLASGLITNEKIIKITFNDEPAKIVSNNGKTVWFTITHTPISNFQVRGYTNDNQEIIVN
ncbi:hypothetical protein [Cohnella lupini]|uniref:Lipoprotein n=1 Tax=Cohnella lupini TaxID=1294267 RepID=A0A3D9IP68_9BACL|nr:hypothetical protein [Cohnella lupini]RED63309.1 hypothetical protein DFP95_104304 [Cohnella lupini]